MTLVLEPERQLAAPRRICPVPPIMLRPSDWTSPGDSAEADAHAPAFVRQARGLVERYPTSATALARLAQAELAGDNAPEAVASARAALEQSLSDEDLSVITSAAITLMASGETLEAESALSALTLEGPTRVLYAAAAAQRRDFSAAFDRLADDDSAEAWGLRGWISLNSAKPGPAVHAYRQVLRRAGPSPAILTNLGLAHALLGETRRAIAVTKQALAMSPSKRVLVGLNLASYHLSSGDTGEALEVIGDLRRHAPNDIEPAFAEAGVHLAVGNTESALRTLRRIRTSLWAYATDVQQAELSANIALVRWHLGKESQCVTADLVIRELVRIDYQSLRIANMLPVLLRRFSETDRFRRLLAHLRTKHPDASLDSLELHLAMLERRFDDAVELALGWAAKAPLDPGGATAATFLLTDVCGDYERAARLGREALRRLPAAQRLANNVAYALALDGHPKEARRYLLDVEAPEHMATHGLIELVSGQLDEARDAYLRAEHMAGEASNSRLAVLVRLHANAAFAEFAPTESPPFEEGYADATPADDDDLSYAVAQHMLKRRFGAAEGGP